LKGVKRANLKAIEKYLASPTMYTEIMNATDAGANSTCSNGLALAIIKSHCASAYSYVFIKSMDDLYC